MSIQEAKNYISLAFIEGFLSEGEAEKLLKFKPQLLIRWAESASAWADDCAGELIEG